MLRPYTISTPEAGTKPLHIRLDRALPIQAYLLHATGGSYITATTLPNPYGRQIKTDTTDTPSDDLVVYAYDANGNLAAMSNPYRTGGTVSSAAYTYDALARMTTVTDSDGRSQQTASYSGNSATFTDEAGSSENSLTGLGELPVLEPNSSGSLSLETDYLYGQNATSGSGSTFTTYQNIVNQRRVGIFL